MSKHTKFPGPAILVPLDMDNFNVFTPPRDVLPGKRRNPSLHVFGTVIYSILTRQHYSIRQNLFGQSGGHSLSDIYKDCQKLWSPIVSLSGPGQWSVECEEHGPAVLQCCSAPVYYCVLRPDILQWTIAVCSHV